MAQVRRVRVLSSVDGGTISDLVDVLARVPHVRADRVAPIRAGTWRRLRAAGAPGSLLARLLGATFPLRVAVDLRVRRGADVVIATTNPFWLPAAATLGRRRPAVIVLVYDVYPDSLEVRRPLPGPLRRVIDWVVGAGLRRADAVAFLGARTRDAVVGRHAVTAPTAVLPTGADPDRLAAPPVPSGAQAGLPAALEGRVVVAYVGNAGSVHDVATLGAALRGVILDRPDVAAVLAATGDRAQDLVGPVRDLPDVHVLGPLDDATWRWVIARTDVALVALDGAAGLASLPSKTYAALASGSAVLAVAPAGSDLADLVDGSGAGAVGIRVDPGDVAAAGAALRRLVVEPGLRVTTAASARTAAAEFTPAALAPRWDALLGAAVAHRTRRLAGRPRARRGAPGASGAS